MIIDVHTHTFPENIARTAIPKLAESGNVPYYVDGTVSALEKSMTEKGIDASVLLQVITNPAHTKSINKISIEINERAMAGQSKLYAFGGIHPEDSNYKETIDQLHTGGVKGIKVHPVYQKTYFDDLKYMKIIDYAMEKDMLFLTHTGYDVSYPGIDYSSADHIIPVLKEIKPTNLILAHMGAWGFWDRLEEMADICPFYVDTAFSLLPNPSTPHVYDLDSFLSPERFVEIVKLIGSDRVLFGSDSPWSDQGVSVKSIKDLIQYGLSQSDIDAILGNNIAKLLEIA